MAKVKTAAIQRVMEVTPAVYKEINGFLNNGLKSLATVMSSELTPTSTALVMDLIRDTKKTVEALEQQMKDRIVNLLKAQGETVTDKGSRQLVANGWRIGMKPYRTGVDPKKLEAMLRAKSKDPAKFMAQKVTYEVDETKLKEMIDKKVLTPDELKTVEYNESWTVETPKRVETDAE